MSTNRGGHRCHVVPIVWPRCNSVSGPLLTDVSVVPSFPVTGRPGTRSLSGLCKQLHPVCSRGRGLWDEGFASLAG